MKRCVHGVYDPNGTGESCSLCNPLGLHEDVQPETPVLALPMSGRLPKCPKCGVPVLVSSGGRCLNCGETYEIVSGERPASLPETGMCWRCGSLVHVETDSKRIWKCADCGNEYKR